MPLKKLVFKPGVNRESTSYANEGGWFASDKIRFRSGQAEKIGGWVKDFGALATVIGGVLTNIALPATGTLWGVARAMWNWVTLSGYNLLAIGTNLKYYIQNGPQGEFFDITPIRDTNTAVANAFTTFSTTQVRVNDPSHGAQTGDFVTISATSGAVNGIPAATMDGEYQITYIDDNTYYITVATAATSSGTPAVSATFAYQITTGGETYTVGVGWGTGGWGGLTVGYPSTGWGSASSSGLGIGSQMRLWSQFNFGERLIFNARGGPLYLWVPATNPAIFYRGQVLSSTNVNTQDSVAYWTTDATCPSLVNYVQISDASRFVIAFGCNDPTGFYATAALDPLQIRWSDQESYSTWTPAVTNQAGDYRLSHGSSIVTAIQTRQEIVVFTDAALYSMQYLGPPYVWGFQILGDNISIAGPNAAVVVNNVTYWMGMDKFYMYSGRVETLPSTLREYVFTDINLAQDYQVMAGTNEGYSEIWWQYCSANSNVIDRYVIYNHLENAWYYGTWDNSSGVPQGRTAWLDSPLRDYPMAMVYGEAGTGSNSLLVYHENGVDDGAVSPSLPINSYVTSSDFDLDDGHNYSFVWRAIPDLTFDGSYVDQPTCTFTVYPRNFPGTAYGAAPNPSVTSTQNYSGQRTYEVQQFTPQIYTRVRGRQMAFQVSSNTLGVQWQLGNTRIDLRPDGRR